MELDYFLGAVAYPVVAAVTLLAIARAFRGRVAWCGSPALVAFALVAVVMAARLHQAGGVVRWPHVSFDWFPWAILCAGILGSVVGSHWLGAAGAAVTPFVFMAPAGLPAGARIGFAMLAGVCAAACVRAKARVNESANANANAHANADTVALSPGDTSLGIAMAGTSGVLSLLVFESNFIALSLILGGFSTAAAALTVLGQVQRPLAFGVPSAVVWCVVMAGGAAYALANDDSGIAPISWWIAAASPVACLAVHVPAIARRPAIAAAAFALAPIACAVVGLALALFFEP